MIGQVLKVKDKMFANDRLMLVHKHLFKEEKIPSHSHNGYDIFFNLIRGSVEVYLDDQEKYVLKEGDVLRFDGDYCISAKALDESDIYIYLIRK